MNFFQRLIFGLWQTELNIKDWNEIDRSKNKKDYENKIKRFMGPFNWLLKKPTGATNRSIDRRIRGTHDHDRNPIDQNRYWCRSWPWNIKNVVFIYCILKYFKWKVYLKLASKKSDVINGGIGPAPTWKNTTKIKIKVIATIDIFWFSSSPIDTRIEPVTRQHISMPTSKKISDVPKDDKWT